MEIRPLQDSDADAWREIRLRMLREHPEAFGEDPGDFNKQDAAALCRRMREGNVIGAWADGRLIGTVGWFCGRGLKRRHIAEIWGMYVAPEARRKGAARLLLRASIDASSRAGVCVWELGVEEHNTGAVALYETEGFKRWGIEPDAYRFDDRSVNIVHMSRPG
jgi:ribosomal protein S18 acetylase RimI-like enzyme